MKRLIISTIPEDFDPANDILLGPWCFLEKEKQYPEWDSFYIEPDPFKSSEDIIKASRITADYANSLISDLADKLNSTNDVHYSDEFWRLLIFPWLLHLVQSTYERQCRIDNVLKKYSQENILVELLPNSYHRKFEDSLDFLHNGIFNPEYNYWIYSRIIEGTIPPSWIIEYGSSVQIDDKHNSNPIKAKNNSIESIRRLLIKRFFTYLRCYGVYGFGNVQSILFSFALSFKKIAKNDSFNNNKYQPYKRIKWHLDFEKIIHATLPICFLNIKTLKGRKLRTKKNKIRLLGPVILWNEKTKYFLGLCLEKGEKFILTQHGCFYGTGKESPIFSEIENKHFAFFSWGWKEQADYHGNIIPLPSPLLSKFANKHIPQNNNLILVGTITYLFTYRLETIPQSKELLDYRKNKVIFLESLRQDIFNDVLYRPYFTDIASLSDKPYFRNKFPRLSICYGDLNPQILKCKLLIMDNPGTTFNIAMAANVPVVCFWYKKHWAFCRQASPYFEALEKAGILYQNGRDAAQKVNEVWDNVPDWWNQKVIQDARKDWCYQYARTSKLWWWEWAKALWKM